MKDRNWSLTFSAPSRWHALYRLEMERMVIDSDGQAGHPPLETLDAISRKVVAVRDTKLAAIIVSGHGYTAASAERFRVIPVYA